MGGWWFFKCGQRLDSHIVLRTAAVVAKSNDKLMKVLRPYQSIAL